MSERKINLEEIWTKYKEFTKAPNLPGAIDLDFFKSTVNVMMLEFGKQLLELAAENAELIFLGESDSDGMDVDKQSILDTIKQIE